MQTIKEGMQYTKWDDDGSEADAAAVNGPDDDDEDDNDVDIDVDDALKSTKPNDNQSINTGLCLCESTRRTKGWSYPYTSIKTSTTIT